MKATHRPRNHQRVRLTLSGQKMPAQRRSSSLPREGLDCAIRRLNHWPQEALSSCSGAARKWDVMAGPT